MRRPIRPTLILVAALAVLMAAGAVAVAAGPNESPPRIAFVARGDGANFADALAVGSIAGQLGAPVFTTPTASLADDTRQGLQAYAPELVVITGGSAAVSEDVRFAILDATGLPPDKVVRAAGENRYGTARAIANLFDTLGVNPAFLSIDGKAADADRLDGLDSKQFLRAGGKAADSDRLDGLNSTQFLRANTVTTSHGGGGWTPVHGDEPSVERRPTRVITQGFGTMYLPLDAPVTIGNTTYRVASIDICYLTEFIDDATFGTVGTLSLAETREGPAGSTILWQTSVGSADGPMTCVGPLAVDRPITTAAGLLVEVGGFADVHLGAVRVTWTRG